MKTPHKHAELIKAWADGDEIEVLDHDKWWSVPSPFWTEERQYRIKPEPKPDFVREYKGNIATLRFADYWESPDLRLTFDGETGKLKSAEVLK